jgi:hypothetical protein
LEVGVRFLRIVAIGAVACACGRRAPRTSPTSASGGLDSARIAQLCESPDSVRAGRRDCVLRDQSRPIVPYVAPKPQPTAPPNPPER